MWYLAFWTCLSFRISQCSAQLRPRDRPCCFWLADAHQSTSWREKVEIYMRFYQRKAHTHKPTNIYTHPCMLYMLTWIPSIYPSHVSTNTSTMDPLWAIYIYMINQWSTKHWTTCLGYLGIGFVGAGNRALEAIWMWVKMEDLGDHRCECLV